MEQEAREGGGDRAALGSKGRRIERVNTEVEMEQEAKKVGGDSIRLGSKGRRQERTRYRDREETGS
jgi:hypothetical protein